MAGIYIHVPFCRQKCYYCDFYKTINTSQTADFLSALYQEADQRKNYLHGNPVSTIYFGGGTPSVLQEEELTGILNLFYTRFRVLSGAEITFEANPDDLTPAYLASLKRAGINRLSIGIQSFDDAQLQKMNRRHNAAQANEAVVNAFNAGFTNLSADLIYGLPGLTNRQWQQNLQEMFQLPVVHLSAYHLTYHQGTAFYTWLKKGTLKEVTETTSVKQFHLLLDEAARAGFEQYEISNFARNGNYSRHNTSYWFGESYLGLGPSAHSYDGTTRRWNVAHLKAYLNAIDTNRSFYEEELLTPKDKFNEYILTRMRTKWGISLAEIDDEFGREAAARVKRTAEKYVIAGKMEASKEGYFLTRDGQLVSDNLMTDFMII